MGTGAQSPLHAQLSDVDLPIALVVGEEDAKFRTIAGTLAAALPRAEVIAIEQAGHAAHLENPATF